MDDLAVAFDSIVVALVLDRWRAIETDKDISPSRRVAALESSLESLVESAGALRLVTREVDAKSAPEVIEAIAVAQRQKAEAAKAAQAARSEALARQIERRTLVTKAADAREALRGSEAVAERLARADAPQREQVLARGAVEGDRRALEEAENALAALDAGGVQQ